MRHLWLLLRARLSLASVVVLIRDARATCVRGKVTSALLQELGDVARDAGIADGLITFTPTRGAPAFGFSASIPGPARQRIRNVWLAHRV